MSMRTLKRNKITLYLAKRDFTQDVRVFTLPVPIEVNFSMASSQVDIMNFGENYVNYFRSNVDATLGEQFHRTDRIYMSEPSSFDILANDADFEVVSAVPQINGKEIMYKRLSGSDESEY